MISVFGCGRSLAGRSPWPRTGPRLHRRCPTSPSAQDTVSVCAGLQLGGRVPVPTTAGTPSSRATIAAWQVRPPRLVTIAAAVFITGCQSGRRGVGHQDLARPEACPDPAASAIDAGDARRDLLADRPAGGQDRRRSLSGVGLEALGRAARSDRLRPRLDDVESAVLGRPSPIRCPSASGWPALRASSGPRWRSHGRRGSRTSASVEAEPRRARPSRSAYRVLRSLAIGLGA